MSNSLTQVSSSITLLKFCGLVETNKSNGFTKDHFLNKLANRVCLPDVMKTCLAPSGLLSIESISQLLWQVSEQFKYDLLFKDISVCGHKNIDIMLKAEINENNFHQIVIVLTISTLMKVRHIRVP